MAGLAGYAASVKIGSSIITEMGKWSCQVERALGEDTEFLDTWESNVALTGKWSGTFDGNADLQATQQAALMSALLNGTSVSLKLYLDGTHNIAGTAFITGMTPGAEVKGLVTTTYSFTGTGAPTYT